MTIARSKFVQDSMNRRGNEVDYVRRIVAGVEANGGTVTHVNDGADQHIVEGTEDVLTLAFDLDECTLIVNTRGSVSFVYLVMGQFPDTVADYGMSLEDVMAPLTDWAYSL